MENIGKDNKESSFKSLSTEQIVKKLMVMIHDGLDKTDYFGKLFSESEKRLAA